MDAALRRFNCHQRSTDGVDTLSNSDDRQALAQFLESIDETTPAFR